MASGRLVPVANNPKGEPLMTSKAADAFHFFRAWLSEPLRVAAVMPSGRALSALMVSEVSPEIGPVIELGL